MSEHKPLSPAADGIEEGRRLILLDAGGGASIGRRLADRLHLLSQHTPLHKMRLKGRYPLKLLAVPDDPILGDARAGKALLAGSIAWRGETIPLDELDFTRLDVSPALYEWLHGFAWLRDLSTVATREQGAPVAEAIMRKWLAAHGEKTGGPAWSGELWGKRILFWTAHAPLILSSRDLVYRSAVLNGLARGARHIERAADRLPPGTGRVAAWAGLVAAGLLLPGGEPRRAFAEAGLTRALAGAFFEDGGSVCRSPVRLLDAIGLLALLRASYEARGSAALPAIETVLARAVPALMGSLHDDHGLTSFQGGLPLDESRIAPVLAGTGIRARPLRQARDWGYQRLAGGTTVVSMDAAPPPVGRLAAGSCASTLAFEMSDGPHRLIVSCGGARAPGATLPAALAEALRTTAAHSTLVLADANSTAILPGGGLGKGVSAVEIDRQESSAGSRVEANHDGYARRFGFGHRRILLLAGDGRTLTGEDALLPAGTRPAAATRFDLRFHLAPQVEATLTADGLGALLRVDGGPAWQFRVSGATLAVEESLWVDADARPRRSAQLVASGETQPEGAIVSWVLKRAG